MRKMSKMMYVNEGHEISIIPSPNGKQKDYVIIEYYNGEEVSYRRETNYETCKEIQGFRI